MRTLLFVIAASLLLNLSVIHITRAAEPDLTELRMMTQLPPELPQRVTGLAYDGEKLWVMIYLGRGSYATLKPSTLEWELKGEIKHNLLIQKVGGSFGSPGGVCFDRRTLWIAGAYGDSFGSIDTQTWKIEQHFKGLQREDGNASQAYAGVAYDGTNLWIAWHWFKYSLPASQTQLILKIDPASGKVLAEYPAPAGARNEMTHALTFDGTQLWHMKGNILSSIDPLTGVLTSRYVVNHVRRATGLAWVDNSLWIAEFDGRIWRLPLRG